MMYSGPVDESMPSTSGIAKESSQERDRRSHPRGSCELFDYTDFGPVILFNLSEGGLGFHGVAAFVEGQVVHLRFVLPGTSKHIEADAQVTRSDDSTKRGGLRFVDLSEEARQRVRTWICGETKVTGLSSTVQTEVHWHPSSAAIDKPESSAADSAARERARILVDAGIAEAPEPKPDEAPPMVSYAPDRAGNESVEPAASPEQGAAAAGIDRAIIVDQTTVDQFTPIKTLPPDEVAIAMAPPATPSSPDASAEATETSLSADPREPLPPPERDGADRASTFAPDTPASGRRGEELTETKEKLPTRQQLERRAYESCATAGGQ